MKKIIAEFLKIALIVGTTFALFWLYDCTRHQPTPVQGKEEVVRKTHTERIDTVVIHDTVQVRTKPKTVVKWVLPELSNSFRYNPCDSVNVQTDTVTLDGAKIAITDTIISNSINARSILLVTSKPEITRTIHDSIFSLRVDTVIIKQRKTFRLCAACFGAGVLVGSVIR